MSNMPERIWADWFAGTDAGHYFVTIDASMTPDGEATEYIRADTVTEELQELAERRQADADANDPLRNIIW